MGQIRKLFGFFIGDTLVPPNFGSPLSCGPSLSRILDTGLGDGEPNPGSLALRWMTSRRTHSRLASRPASPSRRSPHRDRRKTGDAVSLRWVSKCSFDHEIKYGSSRYSGFSCANLKFTLIINVRSTCDPIV